MALSDQLKAYYKLDESSGDAVDATGGGYTLTNNGVTTFTTGKINNAADLGTTNNSKYFKRAGYTVVDGQFTISCWVKLTTEISSGTYVFVHISGNSTLLEIKYEYNSGTRRLRLNFGKNNRAYTYADKTVTLGTSNWYHIVATYDQSYLTLYVDGVQETPVAASGVGTTNWSPGGGYVSLGVTSDANDGAVGYYASCYIDEVAIYQRGLSATEVESLYTNGIGNQYPFLNSFSLDLDAGEYTFTDTSAKVFTSTIANVSKPATSNLAKYLSIGGGFELLVGSLNRLLISPLGSFSNESKVASSLVNISLGAAGALWSSKRFPWTESTPWTSEGGIINENKI